jgi:hypothetical protein
MQGLILLRKDFSIDIERLMQIESRLEKLEKQTRYKVVHNFKIIYLELVLRE